VAKQLRRRALMLAAVPFAFAGSKTAVIAITGADGTERLAVSASFPPAAGSATVVRAMGQVDRERPPPARRIGATAWSPLHLSGPASGGRLRSWQSDRARPAGGQSSVAKALAVRKAPPRRKRSPAHRWRLNAAAPVAKGALVDHA
jgi:hypothetical protein